MKRARIASALAAALLLSGAAHALSFRAYLSANGNDANPCTVALPCRLLPAALGAVISNGEIWILDSANYNPGPVSITKSVSIIAIPGAIGSFAAVGGNPALVISGVDVKLRNVLIVNNASSNGSDGIQITGGSLDVSDSAISVPNTGISATNAVVRVHNTLFRDSGAGVQAYGSSTVDVTHSRFANIGVSGVWGHADSASANGTLSVEDSSFANVQYGVIANSEAVGSTIKAAVSRCTFAVGNYGVSIQNLAGSGARGTVSGSSFSNHTYALANFGGAIFESAGNNTAGSTNGATSTGAITNIGTI